MGFEHCSPRDKLPVSAEIMAQLSLMVLDVS